MLLFRTSLIFFLTIVSSLLGITNASYPPDPYDDTSGVSPMVSDARAEAVSWLTLMDQVQYGPTWDEAGPLLKDVVTRQQWIGAMNELRRPLGYVSARQVRRQRTISRLHYGTQGYFMEIQFTTSFWGKASATEKCILMFDDRSNWRVISYIIK